MMNAVEYLKQKRRITNGCKGSSCPQCPFDSGNNRRHIYCAEFEQNYPQEAVSIVEKWAKEHPVKTYMSLFLEKFPNARLEDDGSGVYPTACIVDVYGEDDKSVECMRLGYTCYDCWNREV